MIDNIVNDVYNIIAGRDTLYTCETELAFKRYVISSDTRRATIFWWLFKFRKCMRNIRTMNIFVYSDESGVFDNKHNDFFVFGGLIILGTEEKKIWSRKYSRAEKTIREKRLSRLNFKDCELKASRISNSEKGKLFRSLNNCLKFSAIVNQNEVLSKIFASKKDKQRYLDFVYKIAVKKAFEHLIDSNKINKLEIENIFFYVDEHTTATNGRYELREGLEKELKNGTYNYYYNIFYPPLFPNLKSVNLEFCNSENKLLVRASDIVANRVFYLTRNNNNDELNNIKNMYITDFPYIKIRK